MYTQIVYVIRFSLYTGNWICIKITNSNTCIILQMASKLLSRMKKRRTKERLLCFPATPDPVLSSPPHGHRDSVEIAGSSSTTTIASSSSLSSTCCSSSSSSLTSSSSSRSSLSSVTSGYISTSSADSSGEERRLEVDQDKVLQVWEKMGSRRTTPAVPHL